MKTLVNIKIIGLFFLLISLGACKDNMNPKPIKTGSKPDPVRDFTVKPVPGGAIVTYKVPEGSDLRYVKATYTLNNGTLREAKSSIYSNSVLVDGFASEGEYDIQLVAVGLGEVESAATTVHITTLRPIHQVVIDEIKAQSKMYATFGGINIDFNNQTESNLVIRVLTKNGKNTWNIIQTTYTKAKNGRIRIRGYESNPRDFGVFITDRWNNKSDTLSLSLTPVFETEFNKALFKQFNLPGDMYSPHPGASKSRTTTVLWDGLHDANSFIFLSLTSSGIPQHFTWDMGVKSKLSRFVFYPDYNAPYGSATPSVWELWGSNDPNPDGTFASWTLVGTFNSVKPSGLPVGQLSAEDTALGRAGEEFEVDPVAGAYKYWRWRTTATWGNSPFISMAEFSFYGTPGQ